MSTTEKYVLSSQLTDSANLTNPSSNKVLTEKGTVLSINSLKKSINDKVKQTLNTEDVSDEYVLSTKGLKTQLEKFNDLFSATEIKFIGTCIENPANALEGSVLTIDGMKYVHPVDFDNGNVVIFDGPVIVNGQTINGQHQLLFVNGKWQVYSADSRNTVIHDTRIQAVTEDEYNMLQAAKKLEQNVYYFIYEDLGINTLV